MAMFVCCVLFFILDVVVLGQPGNGGPSIDANARASVSRAVHWLKAERREDLSWGDFTPRALVAISLAQDVVPISKDEMTIMVKQLNILLSLELGRNLSTKSLGLSRLALYVNALYATCQDPRNFHGLDLVQILRSRTDSALVNASGFSLPVVFIPLCLAQDFRYDDVLRIISFYNSHRNKTDLQALALLGLSCIAEQNRSSATIRKYVESYVADFLRHFRTIAPTTNVYTLALSLQVLRSFGSPVDVDALLAKQLPDGSFGSFLATYYALPALLGKNVFTFNCSGDGPQDPSISYPLSATSSPQVHYSVWMGEGEARDSHSITVNLLGNGTLFAVMQMAQARNPNFRFSYEVKDGSKRVYSLGGVPNDMLRELYWILYKSRGEPKGFHPERSLHKMTKGVDEIHPAPEDHFIFWFRRHSP